MPDDCDLVAPREKLAFYDSQSIPLPRPVTALEAWNLQMARPLPLMALAFRIRDAISARFGVKRIGGFSGQRADRVAAGDRLDFFLVERVTPQVLTLTERDRHLDVMTCITTTSGQLAITSSVITHNLFGRAYMLPVGPAHKVIVRAMLRRLARDLAA
jgi:hypothetical protein